MVQGPTPSDAAQIASSLRLGWSVAELKGRVRQILHDRGGPAAPARLQEDRPLPLGPERTPAEQLIETQLVVCALVTQLGLDVALDGGSRPPPGVQPPAVPPEPASARVATLIQAASNGHAPGSSPDQSTLWQDFTELLFRWDAHIQDTLATLSFAQSAAYQLGRGLAEVSWELDPTCQDAASPRSWDFLLSSQRRSELTRSLLRLGPYLGPITVPAVTASITAWGKVARDQTRRAQAMPRITEQAHVWRSILIAGADPKSFIEPHRGLSEIRALEIVVRAFWLQILLGTLGLFALAFGVAEFFASGVSSTQSNSRFLALIVGVLGTFGISVAGIVAKSKASVQEVIDQMRFLYYTDMVADAITLTPPRKRSIGQRLLRSRRQLAQ